MTLEEALRWADNVEWSRQNQRIGSMAKLEAPGVLAAELRRLQAENERLRERIAQLEAQVAFLQGAVHKNDDTVKWVKKPIPRSGDAP